MDKLEGYKTYITVAAGLLFNVLAHFGWLPEGMTSETFVEFANVLLGFAALGFMRSGIKKTDAPAPAAK